MSRSRIVTLLLSMLLTCAAVLEPSASAKALKPGARECHTAYNTHGAKGAKGTFCVKPHYNKKSKRVKLHISGSHYSLGLMQVTITAGKYKKSFVREGSVPYSFKRTVSFKPAHNIHKAVISCVAPPSADWKVHRVKVSWKR